MLCLRGLIVIVIAASHAGCSLDRGVRGIGDDRERDAQGAVDAARMDGAAEIDADLMDSGVPDAGPLDTGPPDTGPHDTGPPSCDSIYGSAFGYMPCQERETECEFATTLESVRSCGSTCAALGGRCIDAYRNEVPFPACERQGDPLGCDVVHVDDICICSRGP